MTTAVFFSFITSLFICMALVPPLQLAAGRLRFMDVPGGRKVHAGPIPRIGGIAFGSAALLSIVFWIPQDSVVAPILFSALVILGFGIWDDRAGLNYKTKLAGQLIAVFIVVVIGGVRLDQLPFLFESRHADLAQHSRDDALSRSGPPMPSICLMASTVWPVDSPS